MNAPLQGAGRSVYTPSTLAMRTRVGENNNVSGTVPLTSAGDVSGTASPGGSSRVTAQNIVQTPFNPNTSTMTDVQRSDATRVGQTLGGLHKLFTADSTGAPAHSLTSLTQLERQQLEGMARTLGFRNLDMLQHHLRNLSPEQRQAVLNKIVEKFEAEPSYDNAVKQAFQEVFRGAIDSMFTGHNPPLPPPVFKSEHPNGDASWDTASLASVYNGLSKIRQDTPGRFATIARGGPPDKNGVHGPLEFVRRETPSINPNANIFDRLSQAAMIAHSDCDNCYIYLYDAAVSGDNNKIVNSVVDKLSLLSRVDRTTNQLVPVYEPAELASPERNLAKAQDESEDAYKTRLIQRMTGDLLEKFKGGDPNRLNNALNYVVGYRGLGRDKLGERNGIPRVPLGSAPDSPEVQDVLRRLSRQGSAHLLSVICAMEQSDAVAQTQSFLRATLPGGSNIRVDGVIGPKTKTMVHAFQASVALNTIKERIEDDPKLPEERKTQLLAQINQEFQQLGSNPERANQILGRVQAQVNALLNKRPAEIETHTAQNLRNDVNQIQALSGSVAFNTQTARYLVDSWLNVMDSGQGLDAGEQLVVHEAGHIWEHQLDNRANPLNRDGQLEVYENWTRLFDGPTSAQDGTAMYQTNTQDYRDQLRYDRASASDYGATNPREDFAEASRVFSYDPQRLMRRSLMKFLYINALNGNPHSPADILRMASECGYSKDDVRNRLNTFLGVSNETNTRFTLPMSNFLNNAYHPLRDLLNEREAGSAPPVDPNISFQLPEPMIGRPQNHSPAVELPGEIATMQPPDYTGTGRIGNDGSFQLTEPTLTPPAPPRPNIGGSMELVFQSAGGMIGAALARAIPATPDQPGWVFEQLANKYRELDLLLKNTPDTTERLNIQHQMDNLIKAFVNQGPGGMHGTGINDLSPGLASFNQALTSPPLNFGENGNVSEQGRAIVAALAISRATGFFDKGKHPEIAKHLPESFYMMQREEAFHQSMTSAAFTGNLQLLGGLERVRFHESNQNTLVGQVMRANNMTSVLAGKIADLKLAQASLMRIGPQRTRTVPEMMRDPSVINLFQQYNVAVNLARGSLNQAVETLNRATGRQYRPLSEEDVQMLLLNTNATIKGVISGENLLKFLQDRENGMYPNSTLNSRLFSAQVTLPEDPDR